MYEPDDGQILPDRGRRRDQGADYDDRREDSYRRQDYSRSPGAHHRSRSWKRSGDPRYEDRDDDYQHRRRGDSRPDERRRDFDAGNYDEMYDEPRRSEERSRHDRGSYSGRDRDSNRSRSPSRHHKRSWSRSPTRDAGQPNDTVILEGLPHSISASELRESLLHRSIAMEFPNIDVRVQSSRGQRRAFVQFEHIDNAVAFVDEHYPKLLVSIQDTDAAPDGNFEAYLHYARRREEWDSKPQTSGNWNCPSCNYSNYPTRTKCKVCDAPPMEDSNWQQSLTGAADASNTPSQILVIYPLASFVDESMLAADMKRLEREKPDRSKATTESGAPKLKSTAPGADNSSHGAREGSLHRVFLMRDMKTDESFKYGFAEFWTLEDATAALTKFNMSRSFTIAGCAVTISTIHMGVFLPEDREPDEYVERQSFHPLFNPTLRVRYRDPHVYPSQMVVTTESPYDDQKRKLGDDSSDQKKAKKRKAEGPAAGSAPKKTAAPMGGQMALWQKKHDELHEGAAATGDGSSPAQSQAASSLGPPKSDPNAPIKISLTGSTIGASADSAKSDQSKSPNHSVSDSTARISYVDRERLMCLICMRKYKSTDEVNIHERSRNHKNATENEELVKAALPRLAIRDKRRGKQTSEETSDQQELQYRDRAKERRQAYNQPTKPAEQSPANTKIPKSDKPNKAEDPKPAAVPASKGAGMLAKMGWTAGAGLGADGAGRTEAIVTTAYQEGAGLGAEGANLGDAAAVAERKTTGTYKDYVNTVQDKARERYNKLG
ncbi:hypothetical protein NLU13_4149 [Sarocladium strictum]|uniref:Uncharacterized protein n=1 Tax=Sarocladium strictum TaxID=5046 RepID=A0AA39L8M7_SARSR|nr:hypothetical protein NLU13_4149 [Sarocladium strictum]